MWFVVRCVCRTFRSIRYTLNSASTFVNNFENKFQMKIYIDLDDVLADFIGGLCRAHNVCPNKLHAVRAASGLWDCTASLRSIAPVWRPATDDHTAFWRPVHARGMLFWQALHPLPWMRGLLDVVNAHDPDFRIVTTPSQRIDSLVGKIHWVARHVPELGLSPDCTCSKRLLFMTNKHELAKPGRLLIDDNPANVKLWQQHGGTGITFMRGTVDQITAAQPVQYVRQAIAHAVQRNQQPYQPMSQCI